MVFAHKIHRWFHKMAGKDEAVDQHPLEQHDGSALTQVEQAGVQE